MQEALQKFGCQSLFVSVIQPADLFCAAHSSMSQFWMLTWHSRGCRKWVWDFSTSSIYFRLNTWSFPWKVDIDKLISGCGRAREQLAMNSRMLCGKFLVSNANSHCKRASHTVKCHLLLFGGTWEVLHRICSLATIPAEQKRCLLVHQFSGYLTAFSWQWNKNGPDLQCYSKYLVTFSPDFCTFHLHHLLISSRVLIQEMLQPEDNGIYMNRVIPVGT